MTEPLRPDQHERFGELSALANTGTLSPGETAELTGHLQVCSPCREIHDQYRLLAREGVPVLAAAFSEEKDFLRWDDTATRKKLLARVRAAEQRPNALYDRPVQSVGSGFRTFLNSSSGLSGMEPILSSFAYGRRRSRCGFRRLRPRYRSCGHSRLLGRGHSDNGQPNDERAQECSQV